VRYNNTSYYLIEVVIKASLSDLIEQVIVAWRQFSNFSAISWREQAHFQRDDEVRCVLDQHADLHFYSASSLKQHSAGRHVAPLNTLFWSEPTSLCFNSLILHVWQRSNKYQFYSLWFDPSASRTHDLPHSKVQI
jgi:hypothetical protein